jgi:DNA-binding phage protein
MAKAVTSAKRERSLSAIEPIKLKTRKGLSRFDAKKTLSNHEAVGQALMECLQLGDPDGFKEILSSYLEVVNKSVFAKKAGIPERTLFRMLTPEGNPTLENLARVFSVLSKAG